MQQESGSKYSRIDAGINTVHVDGSDSQVNHIDTVAVEIYQICSGIGCFTFKLEAVNGFKVS